MQDEGAMSSAEQIGREKCLLLSKEAERHHKLRKEKEWGPHRKLELDMDYVDKYCIIWHNCDILLSWVAIIVTCGFVKIYVSTQNIRLSTENKILLRNKYIVHPLFNLMKRT